MKKRTFLACITLLASVTADATETKDINKKLMVLANEIKETYSKLGITAKLGTLGAGLDLTYKIKPNFNARLNINKASADYEETNDGVDYRLDLDLFTVGALLDFHPYQNGFRLTGGLFKNNNKISAVATNPDNIEIGNTSYNITDGSLNSSISFNSVAPYLGIGWGNAVKGPQKWHFSLDMGILFQGEPITSLTANGIATSLADGSEIDLSTDETLLNALALEEENLNSEIEDYTAYPVISMGISYKF